LLPLNETTSFPADASAIPASPQPHQKRESGTGTPRPSLANRLHVAKDVALKLQSHGQECDQKVTWNEWRWVQVLVAKRSRQRYSALYAMHLVSVWRRQLRTSRR